MEEPKRIVIITLAQTFHNNGQTESDGETSAFLERICPNLKFAETILERLYEDAKGERGYESKYGLRVCEAKWISENEYHPHTKLSVMKYGSLGCRWECVYEIQDESETHIYSKYPWID